MPDSILVAAGQCGNQLAFELLNYLLLHAKDKRFSAQNGGGDVLEVGSRQCLMDLFFASTSGDNLVARTVCLDTEPKVIDECLRQSQSRGQWSYDPKSVAYRHGGAGNNWALGYAMASDTFLETSLNCIRRQVERAEHGASLTFIHSLAGGTGSGLGTRITEACRDEFSDLTRFNIAVAPHHFGEVVVQYYNALLCLSKVSRASHGILLFENEVAQQLCKEMHGIEKPLLKDLNHVIASNLLPILLPKFSPFDSHSSPRFQDISHDLAHLCSNPSYRFINIKLTPQTSKKSIDFTFDSWSTLLKTIQRLQLSGTASERHISRSMRHASGSPQQSAAMHTGENTVVARAYASAVTCHGNEAVNITREFLQAAGEQQLNIHPSPPSTSSTQLSSNNTVRTPPMKNKMKTSASPGHQIAPSIIENALIGDFLPSHSILPVALGGAAVKLNASSFALNRYQRSCSILSNDQSILPMLQRPWQRSKELFDIKAYLHQYHTNGLENDDFIEAFRSISTTIHEYSSL